MNEIFLQAINDEINLLLKGLYSTASFFKEILCLYNTGLLPAKIQSDFKTAIEVLVNQATPNQPQQLFIQATILSDVYKRHQEAVELYEKAIHLNHADSITFRARLFENGLGGAKNLQEAIRQYEKAIELGSSSAFYHLGYVYDQVLGGEDNRREAKKLYKKAIAVEVNSSVAMTSLALMYQAEGQLEKAIELFKKAITLRNSDAMKSLGFIYQHKNMFSEAIDLYEDSIALGNIAAMSLRAKMYEQGLGGPQNYPAAFSLYQRAYRAGSVNAMHHFAIMYIEGKGCAKNKPEGVRHLRAAASFGFQASKEKLKNMNTLLSQYHFLMTDAQLKKVADLILKHREIKSEFLEFDLGLCVKVNDLMPKIIEVLEHLKRRNAERLLNTCIAKLLINLHKYETTYELTPDLYDLKNKFIKQLKWGEVSKRYIVELSHILTDLWISSPELANSTFCAENLAKIISRIRSFEDFDYNHLHFSLIKTIFVKHICGDQYEREFKQDEKPFDQLCLLASLIHCNSQLSSNLYSFFNIRPSKRSSSTLDLEEERKSKKRRISEHQ